MDAKTTIEIYNRDDTANVKLCQSALFALNKHKARVIYDPSDFIPKNKLVDLIIELQGNEFIACHSFLFKISPKISEWWPDQDYETSKRGYKYKIMDMTKFSKSAVKSVIDFFYSGTLNFKKSEKHNVHALLKGFQIDIFVDAFASIDFNVTSEQPLRYRQKHDSTNKW